VRFGKRQFVDYFVIVDADVPALLGNRARQALGLNVGGLAPAPGAQKATDSHTEQSDRAQLFDEAAAPL
jgi:hypothetical protein